MKFDSYITNDNIVFYICRIRAKYAKQRSKLHLTHILSGSPESNYHLNHEKNQKFIDDELKFLSSILPARKKWKTLKKKNRYKTDLEKINSIDYNTKSLLITIEYYRKNNPSEPFLLKLEEFIKIVQNSFEDENYIIDTPKIIPQLKGDKHKIENKCRPISLFKLRDRIVISLTNKYFTNIFDKYFYDKSFAFRAVRRNGLDKNVVTHHDAIQSILDYKKEYTGKRLWVSECDISKFYDSVHHTTIKRCFQTLLKVFKKESPELYDIRAEKIFYKYLECYSFPQNVLIYNKKENESFWQEKRIPGGKFGWIEKDLYRLNYFKNISNARIGVPQGGALSGLIANLVLNDADKQMVKKHDESLCYVRFCDDMVIIHSSKRKCLEYAKAYKRVLTKLKLVPHEFEQNIVNSPSFWSENIKSKYPYKWSLNSKNAAQWFGFVGYEIKYNGDLRVRMKSLRKEKTKQNELVKKTIQAVRIQKRKSDNTIFESVLNRLIGMSVGRINMKNYLKVENEMCWVNGFSKLNDNKNSRAQLKSLDKNRAVQVSKLLKEIKKLKSIENIIERTISKFEFSRIQGITNEFSVEIRAELVDINILNSKFQLKPLKINLIKSPNYSLALSERFSNWNGEIVKVLLTPKEDREVNYYGKPFSYYHNIIEKGKGTSR